MKKADKFFYGGTLLILLGAFGAMVLGMLHLEVPAIAAVAVAYVGIAGQAIGFRMVAMWRQK